MKKYLAYTFACCLCCVLSLSVVMEAGADTHNPGGTPYGPPVLSCKASCDPTKAASCPGSSSSYKQSCGNCRYTGSKWSCTEYGGACGANCLIGGVLDSRICVDLSSGIAGSESGDLECTLCNKVDGVVFCGELGCGTSCVDIASGVVTKDSASVCDGATASDDKGKCKHCSVTEKVCKGDVCGSFCDKTATNPTATCASAAGTGAKKCNTCNVSGTIGECRELGCGSFCDKNSTNPNATCASVGTGAEDCNTCIVSGGNSGQCDKLQCGSACKLNDPTSCQGASDGLDCSLCKEIPGRTDGIGQCGEDGCNIRTCNKASDCADLDDCNICDIANEQGIRYCTSKLQCGAKCDLTSSNPNGECVGAATGDRVCESCYNGTGADKGKCLETQCGSYCKKDADCVGALVDSTGSACTRCDTATNKCVAPVCGDTCDARVPDVNGCAGASAGAGTTEGLLCDACVTDSSGATTGKCKTDCVYKASLKDHGGDTASYGAGSFANLIKNGDVLTGPAATALLNSMPSILKNSLNSAINACLAECYTDSCVDVKTYPGSSGKISTYAACEGAGCMFKKTSASSSCDTSCVGGAGDNCCWEYRRCGGDITNLNCLLRGTCKFGNLNEQGAHGKLDECIASKFVKELNPGSECTIPENAWKGNQATFARLVGEDCQNTSFCYNEKRTIKNSTFCVAQCNAGIDSPACTPACIDTVLTKVSCAGNNNIQWCGDLVINFANTPVSLILTDELHPQVGVSNFQLNPNAKDKWYVWRGSEARPLLVWDPKGTKQVQDATQLFGQHTFGKKWSDGFAALASLDKDKDGKISGKELDGLALWFDKGTDGVVSKGEIKTLDEVGITALYFEKSGDNTKTGDIIVAKGFAMKGKDGKTTYGAAIDWIAKKGYDTKAEAAVEANALQTTYNQWYGDNKSTFGGVWVWAVDEEFITKDLATPVGAFVFSERDGTLKGVSASGADVESVSKKINQMVNLSFIEGKRVSEGANQVKFVIMDKNGLKTETTAELSADGRSLTGVSRAEMIYKNKKEVNHYTWKAIRSI